MLPNGNRGGANIMGKPKKEKKLTPRQMKQLQNFNTLRKKLLEKGYTEKKLSFDLVKANLVAFISTLPIVLVLLVLYIVVNGVDQTASGSGFMFIIMVLVGIVIHELIHGAVGAVFAKNKWQSIHFGFDWATFTPYCHCAEALSVAQYALVVVLPTLFLGFLPYLIGLAFSRLPIALYGLLFIFMGGGDAYILWLLRKERQGIILDHPFLGGCVIFHPQHQDDQSMLAMLEE